MLKKKKKIKNIFYLLKFNKPYKISNNNFPINYG